jgi:hypothetical protein
MANPQETEKEQLRALLNFPVLMLPEYSQDAYAEERVGAVLIRHTREGRSTPLSFQKLRTKH